MGSTEKKCYHLLYKSKSVWLKTKYHHLEIKDCLVHKVQAETLIFSRECLFYELKFEVKMRISSLKFKEEKLVFI